MTDPAQAHRAFDAEVAAAAAPGSDHAALHRLADAVVGARLFTVMTVDMAAGLARPCGPAGAGRASCVRRTALPGIIRSDPARSARKQG